MDDPLGYITDADINPPVEPLPEPTLTSVDDIVAAMQLDGLQDQVVVSMLATLGIGIYGSDGSVIHKGREQRDGDLYLTEDEVRGLIAMLQQGMNGENWMNFRDFHAALTDFGYEGTPEDLLAAYVDAYAEFPDEPITRLVQSQAFLDVEAQIPPLGVWLLFVDGMVGPNPSSTAMSAAGMARVAGNVGAPVARGPAGGVGAAYQRVQANTNKQVKNPTLAAAQLLALSASLKVSPDRGSVHEGHNGAMGQPVTIRALVPPVGVAISGLPALGICINNIAGAPITWQYDSVLDEHGEAGVTSGYSTPTDSRGEAELDYIPNQESANGHGYVVRKVSVILASISRLAYIRALCGGKIATQMSKLIGPGNLMMNDTRLAIEWHERRVLHVKLTDLYDAAFDSQFTGQGHITGTDTIDTVLVQQDDGSWAGAAFATAQGIATEAFGGQQGCPQDWRASQVLDARAEMRPGRLVGDPIGVYNGNMVIVFNPASPPRAAYATSLCPAMLRPGTPYKYLPFNDSRIWSPELGYAVKIPPPPDPWNSLYANGDAIYDEHATSGTATLGDLWTVTWEYPNPDPPGP